MASPTLRASNVWPIDGGDDVLQITGQGGAVLGGITAGGAGFGALAGGGGGTPGGSNGQLQFNNSGAFDGISVSTWVPDSNFLLLTDPALSVEIATGASTQNIFAITPDGITLQANEPGDTLQLLADSDVNVSSGSGTVNLSTGGASFSMSSSGHFALSNDPSNTIAFYGAAGSAQQTITGSKNGNVALANIITALANLGIIIDATT